MRNATVQTLIPVLQTAIGPVILISGVGLLLLTMTNRFGRVIDRSRLLGDELLNAHDASRAGIITQLSILSRRARAIRIAIIMIASSALCDVLLIVTIFCAALFDLELAVVIGMLFILSMIALTVSLVAFLLEVNQSLAALKLEMKFDGWK
jgi:hypothetical protein